MRTASWVLIVLVAGITTSCELDDVYFDDFLNDMTVNQDGDGPPPNPICGDGRVDPGEQCDDGNWWDGDGCSSWCTIEQPGCYDEYGYFHYIGAEWSYDENVTCFCFDFGGIECWEWDYPDEGCEFDGEYYEVGDFVYVEGMENCQCVGAGTIECGDVIVII